MPNNSRNLRLTVPVSVQLVKILIYFDTPHYAFIILFKAVFVQTGTFFLLIFN